MKILNWLAGFHLVHEEQMEFISEDMGFIVIRNDGDFKISKFKERAGYEKRA